MPFFESKELDVDYDHLKEMVNDLPRRGIIHNDILLDNYIKTSNGYEPIDFENATFHHEYESTFHRLSSNDMVKIRSQFDRN